MTETDNYLYYKFIKPYFFKKVFNLLLCNFTSPLSPPSEGEIGGVLILYHPFRPLLRKEGIEGWFLWF